MPAPSEILQQAAELSAAGEALLGEYETHAAAMVTILGKLSVINAFIRNVNQGYGESLESPEALRRPGVPKQPPLAESVCLPAAIWGGSAWLGNRHKATQEHGPYLTSTTIDRPTILAELIAASE